MKWRRWAIAAVVVLLVEYPLALLFGPKSDAFREAERFVRDNPAVREYVGNVRKVTISPFGFYIYDWGDGGAARFDLEISGDLRGAEIHTELEKGSMWVVRFATLAREHESPILPWPVSDPDCRLIWNSPRTGKAAFKSPMRSCARTRNSYKTPC